MKDKIRDQVDQYGLSDRVNEELVDKFPEEIGRREILLGFGAVGLGGLILPIPVRVDEKLSREERRFAKLSVTLEKKDLRDPQNSHGLQKRVKKALGKSRAVLNDDAVRDGKQVDEIQRDLHDTVNFLPGVDVPAESRTTRRLSALAAAYNYYSALENTLEQASTLTEQLKAYETVVLYYDQEMPPEPMKDSAIAPFIKSTEKLSTDKQPPTQTISGELNRLLPSQELVVDQLREQRDIYRANIAAQQAYLKTGMKTERGARRHEQSDLSGARQTFEAAGTAADINIAKKYHSYALQDDGLTLGQYQRLFNIRHGGIKQLLSACDSEVNESTRRMRFNRGLDRLFDARQLVTSESYSF